MSSGPLDRDGAPAQKPIEESPTRQVSPEAIQAVPTAPLAFTGITPCRVADTRGNGSSGQYGPAQLTPSRGHDHDHQHLRHPGRRSGSLLQLQRGQRPPARAF